MSWNLAKALDQAWYLLGEVAERLLMITSFHLSVASERKSFEVHVTEDMWSWGVCIGRADGVSHRPLRISHMLSGKAQCSLHWNLWNHLWDLTDLVIVENDFLFPCVNTILKSDAGFIGRKFWKRLEFAAKLHFEVDSSKNRAHAILS